jgi:hypothetical protein
VTGCRPMTLPDLGRRPAGVDDAKTRWKLGWEFLEEYRWEPDDVQLSLLCDERPATDDERWNVLLAALAERLAAQHDRAAPARKVADDLGLPFKPWAVREIKDFSERTVLLASGQPVGESAAVPVMPSELTVCCGEGRSMLSV